MNQEKKIIGVGRPRIFHKIMRPFSAYMAPKHIEMAKIIGDGNCSKGIRVALVYSKDIAWPKERHAEYIENLIDRRPIEYVDRKISIRITIAEEIRQMAMKCANSVAEGIRVALELYGSIEEHKRLSIDNINVDIIKKLDIIRIGLYKKH